MINHDGTGAKPSRVFDVPVKRKKWILNGKTVYVPDYWASVTDVLCPECRKGKVRWAEAGYVPGYRICDCCGAHYQASQQRFEGCCTADIEPPKGIHPTLERIPRRRNG
jgi:hypothetical protein